MERAAGPVQSNESRSDDAWPDDRSTASAAHDALRGLPPQHRDPEALPPENDLTRPEDDLARLAASVGPLRRVLAAIAERLVTSRGWERLCFARLSDYARERPGLSVRQLQELARVDRALSGLPSLERALVRNELPWSKVRLIARVADTGDEGTWIARARATTTRGLESATREAGRCAGARAPGDVRSEEATQRVVVRCTPAVREKWAVAHEMAERVAGERLRAGEVLEAVAAEVFAALPIDPARVVPVPPAPRRGGVSRRALARESLLPPHGSSASSHSSRPRPSAPHVVAALAANLDEADAFELDRRLCRATALERTLDAAMAPLLRIVASSEHDGRETSRTMARFAPDELGMSSRKARSLLRLERAMERCPALRDAFRSGRLSWVKAQTLLPLIGLDLGAEADWRAAWVAWAARVTVRRLAGDVERALLLRAGHPGAWQRCRNRPERARDPIPPGERPMCAPAVDPDATSRIEVQAAPEVAVLFRGVRETLRARMGDGGSGCGVPDGVVLDRMLDLALATWNDAREPGARRRDPVIERDGYRCVAPGCSSRRNLHDHHIVFRSAGGSDAAENRVTLCAFHHHRCLHAGRMRIRGRAPDGLEFALGTEGGRAPWGRFVTGDVRVA